jgi:Protein of unknown function (DUF541)
MRLVIPAATVPTVSLIAAGMLGVASAEAPTTTTPPPTVSVQGVATEPIEQTASAATATAVYRQGMADAISDGQAKAQFLASKAGVTVGAVQSIVEGGGYIGCTSSEESSNDEYQGAQPDFGSPAVGAPSPVVSTPRAVTEAGPGVRKPATKHKRKHKKPAAKQASATTCTLSAQVSLVYTLG